MILVHRHALTDSATAASTKAPRSRRARLLVSSLCTSEARDFEDRRGETTSGRACLQRQVKVDERCESQC